MTHQSSIMSGVLQRTSVCSLSHTHTHAHTHTLKASLQLSNPISVWLLVSFCSRLLKASPEPGGNASHTLICHYRETAVQPAESEQSGRGGREKKARRRARVHVRVTRDGWLVCMYKMCRRGFVHVCGRGWVGERGGMCLCVRSGANTAGAGWGFVDQQPMTGCHTLTHRAPKSSPVWGASVRPSLTLWDGPESNPAITPTQPTRRENTGSCQHNEKRSLSLLTFAEAPLFRVWGVGRGGKLSFGDLLQQYEGTVLFFPEPGKHSDFRLLTQRKGCQCKPPRLNKKKPHQRASLCPLLTFERSSEMPNTCGWFPVLRLKWPNTIRQHLS